MKRAFRSVTLLASILCALLALPAPAALADAATASLPDAVAAQGGSDSDEPQQGQSSQGQQQSQEEEEDPELAYSEVVVVTASRSEQLLLEAPVAMSVIDATEIEVSPAKNYADLLRSVPGLNVSQTSARDINLSSRSATSTLDASQLVLVDGRSVYQDFFGFVAWDLLPINFSEIQQVEVIRGAGSAVWGANATSGVVNIITKTPRQLGNAVRLKVGGGEQGTGFGSLIYSAVRDKWSYKLSASYQSQEPWPRPGPLPNGIPRDSFPNQGTKQPKFDLQVNRQLGDRSRFSFAGGLAGTGGIIHTGIGPFNITDGTTFSYFRTDYDRDNFNARVYVNILDGDAINLLNGLQFFFDSQIYDLSASNSNLWLDNHVSSTYGGNLRLLNFDLSIAPGEDSRSEGGVFLQNSVDLGDHVQLNAGGRVDWFSVLDDPVFSPRVSLLISPHADHTIRGSFNRAYRAPSLINNFLQVRIFNVAPLPSGPFVFPSEVFGNPSLVEESVDQWEVGYRGIFADGKISVDIAAYRTETTDSIDFFNSSVYTAFDPPPGWPLPNFLLPPFGPIELPKEFTYRNIGEFDNQGIEVGIQARPFARNQLFINYSWQDRPDVVGIPFGEVNLPPENRFNVGWSGWAGNWYYGASVNHVGEAFWTDVLDSRFFGFTDAYTTVNASFGVLLLDGTAEISVRGTNLGDEDVLQHVFGDVIGRRVIGEFNFFFQ